ncbi:cation-translocating P-type ATPase [Corallincola platygyrae]|uniref:Cation-translocating P-type ATPase n=1 Tax=Corallincola platygyrae TaxID=1193278 RepID=A0ABW4XIC8_9GAMM
MPGLSASEAEKRLAQYGLNQLPEAREVGPVLIFVRQFKSPFIYVLFVAAVVSWLLNQQINSFFIGVVLLLNAVIGTVQEYSAARAAKALRNMVPSNASVYRDECLQKLDAQQLVPGDVVQLVAGDKIPADIRITDSTGLSCDESMLTGESLPQAKRVDGQVMDDAPITERHNMLFAGTLVSHGRALGEVEKTGATTEIGQIAHEVGGDSATKPPLLLRIERFTRRVSIAVIIIIALLFMITIARGDDLTQVFLMGVALAVSAIPEGLPAAITVALAIGMRRMAKVGVIVRKLLAVEALGSCTHIASDKTGTLTLNEMTIQHIRFPDDRHCQATGEGMDLHGEILPTNADRETKAYLKQLVLCGALANEAVLQKVDQNWRAEGDNVDIAFLVLAAKLGFEQTILSKQYPQLALCPYESENAYSATICQLDQHPTLFVKGSVERLLSLCSSVIDGTALDPQHIMRQTSELARKGYRVLALASRTLDNSPADIAHSLQDLTFLGIVGMQDPLRPGVKAAVESCQSASIQVSMVTGDHPDTALAIAEQLELSPPPTRAVTGPELGHCEKNDKALAALVSGQSVFARVEPKQKQMLVESLEQQGDFIAVTGDGVNDAPALRRAHVGVAMGKRGTDVARESADLIITDDNFSSIVEGVRQGRIVYGNIRKVVFLLISTGAAEIVLFILSVLMGLPLPLLPIQLLWLNLVTNGLQDKALAFEPAEGNELHKPPRPPQEAMFNRLMIERVIVNAVVMGGVAFFIFITALEQGQDVETARNTTLLLMVLFENIHVFNSRSETISVFRQPFFGNPYLLVGMLCAQGVHIWAMHSEGLASILQLQPVSLELWGTLLLWATSLIVMDELHKLWHRYRHPARNRDANYNSGRD